ncbi:hypothetical protein ES703_35415 [subsurface metagenome]
MVYFRNNLAIVPFLLPLYLLLGRGNPLVPLIPYYTTVVCGVLKSLP